MCEYRKNPCCIDIPNPRFSWKIGSEKENISQTSFEIRVWEEKTGKAVWNCRRDSGDSVHVEYGGEPLRSNRKYVYAVTAVLNDSETVSSGKEGTFETGFMDGSEWKGRWIGAGRKMTECPVFRKTFHVSGKVERARLFITAKGLYDVHINGKRAGDYELAPGWSSYHDHMYYQAIDVTELVTGGENGIGVRLGEGWYNGEISFNRQNQVYGKVPAFLAQLVIENEKGEQVIISDRSWMASGSGILFSGIYDGEIYDKTKEPEGFSLAGFDDSDWEAAEEEDPPEGRLCGMANEGTKRIEEISPLAIICTPAGETLIDMGQNMVGWLQIRISGRRGDELHFQHGEVLDGEGNFYFENIRTAKQETRYILSGEGEELLEPHFTFQGFRYVKVLKFPGPVRAECFRGIVLHTAIEPAVEFSCSDERINQLWHNLVWGQKGNFLDVPTDCPQRDERLGWTGDAQIFCRTACFNFLSDSFFTKWLQDVKADQYQNGAVPFVVPDVLPRDWRFLTEAGLGPEQTSAAWGDAVVIVPWTLYLCYGDKRILEDMFPAMERYITYIREGSRHGSGNPWVWDWGAQLGDWLALDNEEGSYRGGTDEYFVATAYYAYSTGILYKSAEVLGKREDGIKYRRLYERIVSSFKSSYMKEGRIVQRTQTAQILPVYFGLLDGKETSLAVQTLVGLLKENDYHLKTGFIGTPCLCFVLTYHGYSDIAYRLLLQEDYPSWLYQVSKGATTIWEHWDGKKPDDTFWSPDMNSFNHYAYGSIGDWLYRCVSGIEIHEDSPGYKHFMIRPYPGDALEHVSCSYESIYGTIFSQWKREGGKICYKVRIPANTTATICLEGREPREVGSGTHHFSCPMA